MPKKRRANQQDRPRGRARRGPWLWRVIKFFLTPPVIYLTLLAAAGAMGYWQWGFIYQGIIRRVAGAIFDFVTGVGNLFGWGFLLVLAAVAGLVWLFSQKQAAYFFRHLNRWLGILAFILAAWGVLGLIGLGGGPRQGLA